MTTKKVLNKAMARRIKPAASWGQLAVSRSAAADLKKAASDLSPATNSMLLFAGAGGTGKTLAAEVLASELRRDLVYVDLSAVAGEYIGETEKNLDSVFADAERVNAVLLLDEADALFGKRTQVNDGHDRYAHIEVSYLLQRMEQHPGIVIVATNQKENIDPALLRRFQRVLDFSVPAKD